MDANAFEEFKSNLNTLLESIESKATIAEWELIKLMIRTINTQAEEIDMLRKEQSDGNE